MVVLFIWINITVRLFGADDVATGASSQPDKACLECHEDPSLTKTVRGKVQTLFVDRGHLQQPAHQSLACMDCHEGLSAESVPHANPVPPVECASCHTDVAATHLFHAGSKRATQLDCRSCHGAHDVARLRGASSPFSPQNQPESCGKCHENEAKQFSESAHGRAWRTQAPDAPSCLTCHRKPIAARSDPASANLKQAQARLCESCHVSKQDVADKSLRAPHFVASFEQGVHGVALNGGNAKSATCIDCHGAHEMNRAVVSGAKISKQNQAATCANCHSKIADEYHDSVHATALRQGNMDSPVCSDCHGEHEIKSHKDPASPVHARNVAQQVCASCHASVRLTQKYGLSSSTFRTFADSYHGLAARGGSVVVVNCASCHGSHGIKAQNDPASPVNKANLVQTCGQCHPGANTRFTVGSVHVSPDDASKGGAILRLIADLYVWFIVIVVGSMTFHNLADLFKKVRRKYRVFVGKVEPEQMPHRLYVRMTLNERLQHAALMISFTALVITGFMLRYPEAWWVVWIRNLWSSAFEWRGLTHRVAGVAILVAGAWHVAYLAFTKPGRSLLMDLLPRWRDVTDPFKVLRYNLGLSKKKPEFPRFSYIEKAEYWALVWGTMLMAITGLILWFENTSMGLVTKLGFDISRTIHFYEAILATLAIFVWHFYFVLFNPDIYPMSLTWLTGFVSENEMREHHPLELERLKAELERPAETPKPPESPEPPAPPPEDADSA
jgi:cytochrome b subunit of formate dehydrogenase